MSHSHDHHDHEVHDRVSFGFWIYIMSDCLLFAGLFATYAVLHDHTFGGPTMKELISLPYVLVETILLLCSSFTFGLGMLAMHNDNKAALKRWLFLTFLLGLSFVAMELHEFRELIAEGHSWQASAFLSAFFSLVGTHGFHVSLGLVWIATMLGMLQFKTITPKIKRHITCLGLFWHFLDIVWIFVFTIVYLMGAA